MGNENLLILFVENIEEGWGGVSGGKSKLVNETVLDNSRKKIKK